MASFRPSSKDILARSDTWKSCHLGPETPTGKFGKPISINRIEESYVSSRVLNPSRLPATPRSPVKNIPYSDLHKLSNDNILFKDLSRSCNTSLSGLSNPTNRTSSDNCLSGPVPCYTSLAHKPTKKFTDLSTLSRSSSLKFDMKNSSDPMPSVIRKHLVSSIDTLPGYVLTLKSSKTRAGKKLYDNIIR